MQPKPPHQSPALKPGEETPPEALKTPGKPCPTCGHIAEPSRAEKITEKDLNDFCRVWRDLFGFTTLPTGGDAVHVTAAWALRCTRLAVILDPYVIDGKTDRADQIDIGRVLSSICELSQPLPGGYRLCKLTKRAGNAYFMLQLQPKPRAEPSPEHSSFTKPQTPPEAF